MSKNLFNNTLSLVTFGGLLMPIKPSSRYKKMSITENGRAKLLTLAKKLQNAGTEILTIGGGDPVQYGFINRYLSNVLIQAAEKGLHMYSYWIDCLSDLKNAITQFEKKHRNVDYNVEDIILAPGVAGAFQVIHYSLLDAGDQVVTFEPTHYVTGPTSYFHIFGSTVTTSRSIEEEDWKPDLEQLRMKINDKTKVIVIVNPNNPTGATYDEKTLTEIVNIAGEYDIPIISDEIYGLITFDDLEVKSIAEIADDVPSIVLSGMSKVFLSTGWRVGYIGFHDPQEKIVEVKKTVKMMAESYGHASSCIATPILYAAIAGFRESPEGAKEMMKQLQVRRDFTYKCLTEIEGISCTKPKGAFYAFPRVNAIGKMWKSDEEFLLELLKDEHLLFSFPGSMYGNSGYGHFRTLLLPQLEILKEAYNRLERFMAKI